MDISTVKKVLTAPQVATEGVPTAIAESDNANEAMCNDMKANPQSVLNLSNMLEGKWGRKPSYKEVMDYIDHLAISGDE